MRGTASRFQNELPARAASYGLSVVVTFPHKPLHELYYVTQLVRTSVQGVPQGPTVLMSIISFWV